MPSLRVARSPGGSLGGLNLVSQSQARGFVFLLSWVVHKARLRVTDRQNLTPYY